MIVGAAGLIAMLSNAPSIVAVDAAKVFLNVADERTPLPYVVVTYTADYDKTLIGDTDTRHVTYTIACWSQTALQAEAVADAVEGVIDAANSGIEVLSRTGGFNADMMTDVSVLTADEIG